MGSNDVDSSPVSIHLLHISMHAFDENIHRNSHSPSIKIWHETRKGVKINSAKYTLGQRRGVTISSKGTIIYLPFFRFREAILGI